MNIKLQEYRRGDGQPWANSTKADSVAQLVKITGEMAKQIAELCRRADDERSNGRK